MKNFFFFFFFFFSLSTTNTSLALNDEITRGDSHDAWGPIHFTQLTHSVTQSLIPHCSEATRVQDAEIRGHGTWSVQEGKEEGERTDINVCFPFFSLPPLPLPSQEIAYVCMLIRDLLIFAFLKIIKCFFLCWHGCLALLRERRLGMRCDKPLPLPLRHVYRYAQQQEVYARYQTPHQPFTQIMLPSANRSLDGTNRRVHTCGFLADTSTTLIWNTWWRSSTFFFLHAKLDMALLNCPSLKYVSFGGGGGFFRFLLENDGWGGHGSGKRIIHGHVFLFWLNRIRRYFSPIPYRCRSEKPSPALSQLLEVKYFLINRPGTIAWPRQPV